MLLFRREALREQDRLHGDLSLAPPVSWQLLGVFLATTVVAAGAFLAWGSYAKATVVYGTLVSEAGIVRVASPRSGTIARFLIVEGQQVRRGEALAVIATATTLETGSLQGERLAALAREDSAAAARLPALAEATIGHLDQLRAEVAAANAAGVSTAGQRHEEVALVTAAEQDLAQAKVVAQRGFVSKHDITEREAELALRRQALLRLDADAATARTRAVAARAAMREARGQLSAQRAAVAQDRAALRRSLADDANARSVVLHAAADGAVAGLSAHEGDAVTSDQTLFRIVHGAAGLHATLRVPPSAAGFLRTGEPIRVAVDAFPYQIYGTVPARLAQVSAAAVPVATAEGSSDVFVAQAVLAQPSISAYGRSERLREGMTVTARIVTRQRSLASWLFDPLLAVARR